MTSAAASKAFLAVLLGLVGLLVAAPRRAYEADPARDGDRLSGRDGTARPEMAEEADVWQVPFPSDSTGALPPQGELPLVLLLGPARSSSAEESDTSQSLSENRLGEGDSPILLRGLRKIGTVPGGFRASQAGGLRSQLADLAARRRPTSPARFVQVVPPESHPFELLVLSAGLLTQGYRPRIVIIDVAWADLSRFPRTSAAAKSLYRNPWFAEELQRMLGQLPLAAGGEVAAAVAADGEEEPEAQGAGPLSAGLPENNYRVQLSALESLLAIWHAADVDVVCYHAGRPAEIPGSERRETEDAFVERLHLWAAEWDIGCVDARHRPAGLGEPAVSKIAPPPSAEGAYRPLAEQLLDQFDRQNLWSMLNW